jgi:anti-sigma B factor antagonist
VREGDERLTVEVTEGDPPTVTLVGEVDPHTAPQLAEVLSGLVAGGATALRIDAARLDFIDSSGLRVLVEAHRSLGSTPDSLVLTDLSPTFRRLLEVTGLDEHVTLEP